MSARYQVLPPTAPVPAPHDLLEQLVRKGARDILARVLEAEIEEFLGRARYQRTDGQVKGYRNGYLPERTIGVGMGAVAVRVPRVSDVPQEVAPEGFQSEVVRRYERRSETQTRLLLRLYLEGLGSGDFEPVFRSLVGGTAGLSEDTILKLREEWKREYEQWRRRPLSRRYVYIFADGLYLKAGLEREKSAVLVVLGVDEDGHKELLAIEEGYRESTESWAQVLRSLRDRGLSGAPLLGVGDGNLGLWAAMDLVYPGTRQQRCWNHRSINLIDRLPKRLQPEARGRLREISTAPTREECTRLRDVYCAELRASQQGPAADCLERDWEEMTTFYDFPQEHWTHLRTSNPIESIFAGVRLRTNAAKRHRVRENVLYLVFKLICRLSLNWRAINAPNQLKLLLTGSRFVDGMIVLDQNGAITAAAQAESA